MTITIFRFFCILILTLVPISLTHAWEPSKKDDCDPNENISPVIFELLEDLKKNPGQTNEHIYFTEPSILFNDETFTLMFNINKQNFHAEHCKHNVFSTDEIDNQGAISCLLGDRFTILDDEFDGYLFDDGTHGDLFSRDGIYSRGCISLKDNPYQDDIEKNVERINGMVFIDEKFRNTENIKELGVSSDGSKSISINDTGFFISLGKDYTYNRKGGGYKDLYGTDDNDALLAIWNIKGPIFDIVVINPREPTGGAGMKRMHDFIEGLGMGIDAPLPPCPNYSHCYSFIDGETHPELIAVIDIKWTAIDALAHEMEHAMYGIHAFNFLGSMNDNTSWSTDGMHIEADSTVNTTLKGPLWDPERWWPYHISVLVDNEPKDAHIEIKSDGTFHLVARTVEDFQLSDIFLYILGVIDEEEADETYYKLINYSVDADKCTDTGYNLNCDLNTQIYFDSVKTFTTQHFVDKYGKYKNTRSSSFDPTNINLGVINISDRKHTNAEIVWKSKIFRSYSSDDIKIQFKDQELEGYTWHYLTKGKSKININFED